MGKITIFYCANEPIDQYVNFCGLIRGVYVLISLHSEDLLRPLLEADTLEFELTFYPIHNNSIQKLPNIDITSQDQVKGTVVMCRKKSDGKADLIALQEHESFVMNEYYKSKHPFLTTEVETEIRKEFDKLLLPSGNDALSVYEAYQAIFKTISFQNSMNIYADYTFDLFLDDLNDFHICQPGYLTVEEALRFLREKQ